MIEDEDSSADEDSNEEGDSNGGNLKNKEEKQSDNDSFCSDIDIHNRSLQSDCGEAAEPENFLRYASEKYNGRLDILEIVDKNERSFKQVAEKMI